MSTSTASTPAELPERPEVRPPGAWAFPQAERVELANGLTALLFDIPGQYVVSVRSAMPLSLSDEPRDREGVALLMARLLDEGTTEHTAEELAELMERRGIALAAGVAEGALGVDLDVPARGLGHALELMREVLAEPSFPRAETERHVRTRLAEIEQERASAPHRAARQLVATYYHPDERASRPTGGSAETIGAVTPEDVADFHRRHVGPQGGTVAVAGDLSGLDVPALLEQTLGTWRAPDHVPAAPQVPARRAEDARRVVLVDRPGSVQTELSVACAGPNRHEGAGWAPYPVLAFVVGGSPGARLDAVLREEKGWTYGVRSAFRPRPADGLFVTWGSVRADSTLEAVPLLLELLASGRDGFTDDEVRSGVDFVSMTAPGRYATADAVADEATNLAVEGLPPDFTTQTLGAVRSLDGDALTSAYRRWVDGDWTVVLVGDAATLAEPLRGLGLGEVTVVPS